MFPSSKCLKVLSAVVFSGVVFLVCVFLGFGFYFFAVRLLSCLYLNNCSCSQHQPFPSCEPNPSWRKDVYFDFSHVERADLEQIGKDFRPTASLDLGRLEIETGKLLYFPYFLMQFQNHVSIHVYVNGLNWIILRIFWCWNLFRPPRFYSPDKEFIPPKLKMPTLVLRTFFYCCSLLGWNDLC